MSNNKIKTFFLIVAIMALLFEGVFVTAQYFKNGKDKLGANTLEGYARMVIDKCENEGYRPACYDREIPKLMDVISMEEAFEVAKLIQNSDDSYWYCHVLGHNLSARETAKDPSRWKDVVARAPRGICSNGAIHGAFQERFREDVLSDEEIEALTPELNDICERRDSWQATGMEQATCYHALGHLTMYITNADIHKSVEICDKVAVKDDGRSFGAVCYDGAFMQIFQPLEPEDFALIEGMQPTDKSEHKDFCTQFSGEKKASCWTEGWPLYFEEIRTPQGLSVFCNELPEGSYRERCYNGGFFVVTAQLRFETDLIVDFCSEFIQHRRGQCFGNAAARMVETDFRLMQKSVDLCNRAYNYGAGETCFEELVVYSTFNFEPGSEDFVNFCNLMPFEWKTKCLSRSDV
ncbi:MAG: hypothetical protein WDZ40_01465 [Candidatus Spechtbacterales bacterium]